MFADESVANNITNMTLLSAIANKEFKDQPPWIYAPTAIQDSARLESHFISKSYAKAFISAKAINRPDELAKFLVDRLRLIQREAKQFLGL